MKINPNKCIGCKACIPYCPMNSIAVSEKTASIDQDECVECGVCLRVDICPVKAIYMPEESYEYPRAIRMQFSDPGIQHPNFKSWGRGTEEAKTNDVTGKFAHGEFGLLLEFGRPGVGTRLTEIEKITKIVRALNFNILEDNPLYGLLEEDMSGKIKSEFVNEKILSGILEFKFNEDELEPALEAILPQLNELDTVVSVGLVTRFDNDGKLPVVDKLKAKGITVRPNAKINIGLGCPLID